MIVVLNGRFETKVRVECEPNTKIRELKQKAANEIGTSYDKVTIRKWWTTLQDDKTLKDYKIRDGDGLELYT